MTTGNPSLDASGSETRGCCKPSPDVRRASRQRVDQYLSLFVQLEHKRAYRVNTAMLNSPTLYVVYDKIFTCIIICRNVFLQVTVDTNLHDICSSH
jgi:hypothetical protein